MKINVIIPVFNEGDSIGLVLNDIPANWVEEVIVVNNGSTDDTARVAQAAGATVLLETDRGYGAACLKGMQYIKDKNPVNQPDIIVFMDGDYADYPEQMKDLVAPIINNEADMVIGSRLKGNRERGSMMVQQIFGNWLATRMMRWLFKAKFSDLGPFRAIRWRSLQLLNMQDTNYGWTIEMQIKAVKNNIRYTEIPVNYRKRIGTSKVSGTIKGTILAGYKIIFTILKYA